MNLDELKEILPHREPMLLVDSVELKDGGAHGIYRVRGDEWFLQGHFPGNPVVPGVILCEIMAQSCAVLLMEKLVGNTPYYTSIEKAKFKSSARPGDVIHVTAEIERNIGAFYFTNCKAEQEDGTLICQGRFSFAVVPGRG